MRLAVDLFLIKEEPETLQHCVILGDEFSWFVWDCEVTLRWWPLGQCQIYLVKMVLLFQACLCHPEAVAHKGTKASLDDNGRNLRNILEVFET